MRNHLATVKTRFTGMTSDADACDAIALSLIYGVEDPPLVYLFLLHEMRFVTRVHRESPPYLRGRGLNGRA